MPRRALAGSLLAAGLLAGALALLLHTVDRTVFDPSYTEGLAGDLLTSEPVRDRLTDALARRIAAGLDDGPVTVPVDRAAAAALDDPRFAAAFAAAIGRVHATLLGEADGPALLDPAQVTGAARDALAAVDPTLAAQLPQDAIRLRVGEGLALPDVGAAADAVGTLTVLATLAAAALLGIAIGAAADREVAARRAGVGLLVLAAGPILAATAAPWLLESLGGGADVAAVFVRATGEQVLGAGVLLAAAGVALLLWGGWLRAVAGGTPDAIGAAPPPDPPAGPDPFLGQGHGRPPTGVRTGPVGAPARRGPTASPPPFGRRQRWG